MATVITHGSEYWSTKLTYSISETDTSYTINANLYYRWRKHHYRSGSSVTGAVILIGGSAKSFSVSKDLEKDGGYEDKIGSFSKTFSKGTDSQTKKIIAEIARAGDGASASATANIQPKRYTLTFNSSGGSSVPSVKVTHGSSKQLPIPTKEHYDFEGWSTRHYNNLLPGMHEAFPMTYDTYSPGSSVVVVRDMEFTALWQAQHKVSFNGVGGVCNTSDIYVSQGESITIPNYIPSKSSCDFLYWGLSAEPEAGEEILVSGHSFTPSSNTVLYARWMPSYRPPEITGIRAYRVADDASGMNPSVKSDGTRVYFECKCMPPVSGEILNIGVRFGEASGLTQAVSVQGNPTVYAYSQSGHLNTDEAEIVTLVISAVDYKGATFTYTHPTYVSVERCLWDTFSGRKTVSGIDKVYQAFAVGTTARDTTSGDIDIDNGDFDVNMSMHVNGGMDIGGKLLNQYLLDFAYPVGSTYITRTNTNPKAWLGGEWELYDKKFKNLLKAATVTRNDSSSFGASINLSDSVVSGYVNFTPSKAMNDTTLKVGQINLSSIGLTALGTSRITAWTDAGNACVLVTLESDGVLNVNDVIGQSTVASGNAVYFSFSKVCVMSNMLDSYCDRFYWRRTE